MLQADGAALLQLRDDKPGLNHAGRWVPPGGHCRPGEDIHDCAAREFLEETEYHCRELHFLESFVDVVDGRTLDLSVYWALYDGVQEPVCHEGQALEFVARSLAAAYDVPAYLVDVWDRALAAAGLPTVTHEAETRVSRCASGSSAPPT